MAFRKKKDRQGHDREFDGLYDDADGAYEDHDHDNADPVSSTFEFHDAPPRRRGCAWAAGCLIPVLVVAGVAGGAYYGYQHLLDNFGSPSCEFTATGNVSYSPEQSANAATVVQVATVKEQLPSRAGEIGVATAITESKLRNLKYGDLDSLGLFQQRPSQGWGTQDQILDPVYASTTFYNRLANITDWQKQPIEVAAQEVQRSAFPSAYADHVTAAEILTASLDGSHREAVACRLDPATTSTSPTALVKKMSNQTGLVATAGSADVSFTARNGARAWALAGWAVTHAQSDGITSVTVGDRMWKRQRGRGGATWTAATRAAGSPTSVRIELAGR
ncbi:hypothetical protein V3G39_15915 [Dermatophilaceae bacterium Sec6.4]|nr:hypothetical protein [Actinomycetota bacterium]